MYETYYSGIWEYQEDNGMLYFYLHLTDNLGGATFLPEKTGDIVTYFRSVG